MCVCVCVCVCVCWGGGYLVGAYNSSVREIFIKLQARYHKLINFEKHFLNFIADTMSRFPNLMLG